MDKQPTAKEIADAIDDSATAYRAYRNARDRNASYAERAALSRLADAACKREHDLQNAARKAFAQRNGWRYTPKQSAANFNYPVLDHVDSFLDENGKRVARVTHSYAPFEEIARFAEANGLIAQRLPWSWWNPDPRRFYWRAYDCIAVLLIPAEANQVLL